MNSGATTTNNGAVAAGTLPLPPPVTSLLAARIATAHLPPVTQVRVNLGLSDCERAPAAASALMSRRTTSANETWSSAAPMNARRAPCESHFERSQRRSCAL